jgi:hypothetical protein
MDSINNNVLSENNFNVMKELRVGLNNIFTEIDEKQKVLNKIYSDLVKTHQDKNYTFGLDSFHFQNRLIQLEYDNMKQVFIFIDNRVYCEYYKLHRILYDFINKEIKEKIIVDKLLIMYKKYPIYKDLEPMKIYDFNVIIEINNTIHNVINDLKLYLDEKKQELDEKRKSSEMGINIHSILHEQFYNNIILEERIHMFENYLITFASHHSKYFSRLTIKLKIMLGIVNEDFKLKNHKSLEIRNGLQKNKTKTKDQTPVQKIIKKNMKSVNYAINEKEYQADDISETSSSSEHSSSVSTSSVSSPRSTINDMEEINVRMLIGDKNSSKEIQNELDSILSHIQLCDDSETICV